jgi:hypothetical protein
LFSIILKGVWLLFGKVSFNDLSAFTTRTPEFSSIRFAVTIEGLLAWPSASFTFIAEGDFTFVPLFFFFELIMTPTASFARTKIVRRF